MAALRTAAPARAATVASPVAVSTAPFATARFEEPLVATAAPTEEDNKVLAEALTRYGQRPAVDDFGVLEAFLAGHPHSVWRLSVLTNLGLSYYHYGYFSKAIEAFEAAWAEGKGVTERRARALADRAAGELLKIHARLGHSERLASLLQEMSRRNLTGQATELRDGAAQGLWMMRHEPGTAYLCGPMALRNLLRVSGIAPAAAMFLDQYPSGSHGTTLAELDRLAGKAGLQHRLIYRPAGAPIPVPSIVHWKVNHFAAIVAERDGRYQLADPTFGPELWVSRAALDAEGSGYFLVPGHEHVDGWRVATAGEAERLYGMGTTTSSDGSKTTKGTPCACSSPTSTGGGGTTTNPNPPSQLMATYDIKEMLVSLAITDTPVGYAPPKGPPVWVTLTYNQREASQPANFSFFNVSPKWTLNWLSYIEDDPNTPGSNVVRVAAGGGYVTYTGYNRSSQAFTPEIYDASVLSMAPAGQVQYQRKLPDGSIEIYGQSNGATSYPRLIFLTQIIDPQGNAVTLHYDAQLRLTTIVDATGRSTSFSYTNSSDPLLITKITDPFGRSARLAYDSSGRLTQSTDVLGLTSQFAYDGSSLVNALTTPYGTTQFAYGQDTSTNNFRYLLAVDPLGHTERLEFDQGIPTSIWPDHDPAAPPTVIRPFNAYLNSRDTFYWDKHALAVAAGNYSAARNRHWAHLSDPVTGALELVTSDQIESVKFPQESRIWYNYPGQASLGNGAGQSGTLDRLSGTSRFLDGSNRTQFTQVQYNAGGNPTLMVDPAGRQTVLSYGNSNLIDVTAIQQQTASGLATVAGFTYNAAHQPLTYTDAAGKATRYAYNVAGQLTKRTDALNESTTLDYNPRGDLMRTVNADGKTQYSFTYDAFDRVHTATDSEGWTITYSYDPADRVTQETYPDGTTRTYQYLNLDLHMVTDRQGRTTVFDHDAVRNLTAVTDPLGNVTKFGYDEAQRLISLTDPNGNVTQWQRDIEGRVTAKQYADGAVMGYGYDGTSHLLFTSDPLQQVKQYAYTTDDRVLSIQYFNTVNPTPATSFTYDPYFPRMTSMTDGSGTTKYGYYPVGVLGALQLASEQPPYANSAIAYQYDALGRVKTRSVGGDAESFGYDKIGRLATHTDDLGMFTRTYLGETGQLTSQNNGIVGTTWTYYPNAQDRRLMGIANTPSASSYGFTSTPEDDITAISDAFNSQTWSYGYDNDDRLQGGTSTLGPKYAYTYDPADNLTVIQRPQGTARITPNALNQVATDGSTAFTYDADGNLLRDYARTYQWDAENRLIAIGYLNNPGTVSTFRYDGLGRRIDIGTTTGGVSSETHYGWCGETLCQARTGTDSPLRRYLMEGEDTPSENTHLYYSIDQLGSVHDALEADNGTSAAHYDYEPYGAPIGTQAATATDFRYAGLFDHQQSGLYLATYRAYDPVVGRWISRDPAGEAIGYNLYLYVAGNTLDFSDPFGLCQCSGSARVLQGNSSLIGQPGGYSTPNNPIPVSSGTAAVIPSQWAGGTTFLRRQGLQISATTSDGTPLFTGVTDVIGGTSPIPDTNVRTALQDLNPGDLILELPSGADMGVVQVTINLPDGTPCPTGTTPVVTTPTPQTNSSR